MSSRAVLMPLVLGLLVSGCVKPVESLLNASWATALPDDPFAAAIPKTKYVPLSVPTFNYRGQDLPGFTSGNGRQADPVNVIILTSSAATLGNALAAAGWVVADPITVANLQRQGLALSHQITYPAAPVSDLFLFGRSQDVAVEKNSDDIDKRDHVRLWAVPLDSGGTMFLAAASRDSGIKKDPRTGLPTHRIDPNLDAERQYFVNDLISGGLLKVTGTVANASASMNGENMAGDPYQSDGNIAIIAEAP